MAVRRMPTRKAAKKTMKELPGEVLEQNLRQQCSLLHGAGRAMVFKVPDPVKITWRDRNGGTIHGRLDAKVWVDFAGVLPGGRSVAFEAKHSAETAFPLSAIKEHQMSVLITHANHGGLSFVYIRRTNKQTGRGADYVVPVTAEGIEGRTTFKNGKPRKSLRWVDLEPYRVGPGQMWLDTVVKLELL